MPTLSSCIRKAGKALSARDADAIREIAREYLGDGLRNAEASKKAIDDYVDVLQTERSDAVAQLEAKGGDISPYLGGVRTSRFSRGQQDAFAESKREAERDAAERDAAVQELQAQENARLESPEVRWNLSKEDIKELTDNPTSARSIGIRANISKEEMLNTVPEPGFIKKITEAPWDSTKGLTRRGLMALTPTRRLTDFLPDSLKPAGVKITELQDRMAGRAAKLTADVNTVIKPWIKLHRSNREESEVLTGVMHRATLARTDPAEAFVHPKKFETDKKRAAKLRAAINGGAKNALRLRAELKNLRASIAAEERRSQSHAQLKKIFDGLSPEAQSVYRNTRDMFKSQYATLQASMTSRIEALDADNRTKEALLATVEKTFESGHIDPYFPLSRYGDYWGVAKNEAGDVLSYSQFDSKGERDRWAEGWKKTGATTDVGRDADAGKFGKGPRAESIDPAFARNVVAKISGLSTAKTAEVTSLVDDIWQTYLQSLPEMSARKQFIHRKGISGFTGDGLKSVADASLRNSRRIAKVEYQPRLEIEYDKLGEAAHELQNTDDWVQEAHLEMRQRHDNAMSYQSAPWASAATGLTYHFHLGTGRISSAAVNLAQTAIVGIPVLSAYAKGKKGSATIELGKASKDVLTLLTNSFENPFGSASGNKRFSDDEQRAFKEIEEHFALFGETRTYDLMGIREGGGERAVSWTRQASEISGFLFHNAEVLNRKVTALAAYRLAKYQGEPHEQAVKTAVKLTNDTHFDYSAQNRPRPLQKDALRVAFTFRNYSVNMNYLLMRSFNDALRGGTVQQREQARRIAAGALGGVMLTSGLRGLPYVWAAYAGFDILQDWLTGDDEHEGEEFNDNVAPEGKLHVAIREAVGEEWGDDVATFVMNGSLDAAPFVANKRLNTDIPNPTLSTRLGLRNMLFQDAREDAPPLSTKWWDHYIKEFAGPAYGTIVEGLQAPFRYGEGDPRWAEKLFPATIADQMRASRYADQGVKTRDGATLIPEDEITPSDLAVQRAGFTPFKLTREYQESSATRFADQKLTRRKSRISKRIKNAVKKLVNDDGAIEASRLWEDDSLKTAVDQFNESFPENRINVRALVRNVLTADRSSFRGIRAGRRRQQLLRQFDLDGDGE